MLWIEALLALILAVVISILLVKGLGRRAPGPAAGLIFFFALLFLLIWAGGLWVTPYVGIDWARPWLSFLAVAILLALLVAALTPGRRKGAAEAEATTEAAATALALTAGVFFWLLLIGLVAAIVAGYVIRG